MTTKLPYCIGLIGIAATIAAAPAAIAQDAQKLPQFTLGVGLGQTELQFREKLDADTTFSSYHMLGGMRIGRFNAALTYADTLSRETISEEDEIGKAERRDVDLTVAWELTDAWTVFVGYKDGETAIDFQVRDEDIRQREHYREDGLYAGIGFRHSFGQAGALSVSLAYVDLDTDLRFSAGFEGDEEDEEADEPPEFDDLEGDYSGDATGYSAAIGWTLPVGPRTAARLQYKINQYDLEVEAEGERFKPDQRLNFLELTLVHAF